MVWTPDRWSFCATSFTSYKAKRRVFTIAIVYIWQMEGESLQSWHKMLFKSSVVSTNNVGPWSKHSILNVHLYPPLHKYADIHPMQSASIWLPLKQLTVTFSNKVKHGKIPHDTFQLASQVEEKPEASSLHQTAKQLLKKTYNLWLFGPLEPVIMSIKHILYINNNRQLKWVLCQGVLVTHFIEKHTPCACGIVSLTPAIESLTQDLKSTPQTSSNWLRHLLTCLLRLVNVNNAAYTGTQATCARSGQIFLTASWCVC